MNEMKMRYEITFYEFCDWCLLDHLLWIKGWMDGLESVVCVGGKVMIMFVFEDEGWEGLGCLASLSSFAGLDRWGGGGDE